MRKNDKIQLNAPAGNLSSLLAAVDARADSAAVRNTLRHISFVG